ncbi:hypothetical protein GGI12_000820 [Dipsacomyces acuminosporus]|nr:hypothetical protein GGI12_000820 [Dipsacomyces acuminosporus]
MFLYLLVILFLASCVLASPYKKNRVVLGYLPVQHVVDSIPWDSLTHANIAFAFASEQGEISFQGSVINSTTTSEQNAISLIAQGRKNGVKVLAAVGGQGTYSTHLATALNASNTRSSFISNAVGFVEKYSLDGIDIDWEYPSNLQEAQNLLSTLQGTRKALDGKFGKGKKLLTITLYNHPYLGPDVPSVDYKPYSDMVDYGFVMAYDYFGSWADTSAPNAPFIDVPFYPGSFRNTTDSWLKAGWPAEKLVAGLAFYGHASVVTADMFANATGQYAPIMNHKSVDGPISQITGTWTWKDLRDPDNGALSSPRTASSGWVRTWDNTTMTPWVYRKSDRLYIGYDDEDSLGIKLDYTLRKKLAGVMIWEVGYDYNNELIGFVKDFITQVDDGAVAENCAPSDTQLDHMFRSTRNPTFFDRRSLSSGAHSTKGNGTSPQICQFAREVMEPAAAPSSTSSMRPRLAASIVSLFVSAALSTAI